MIGTREIRDYNVKTDCKDFFDQPIMILNHTKIATGQGDDYTTGF